VHLKKEIKII